MAHPGGNTIRERRSLGGERVGHTVVHHHLPPPGGRLVETLKITTDVGLAGTPIRVTPATVGSRAVWCERCSVVRDAPHAFAPLPP